VAKPLEEFASGHRVGDLDFVIPLTPPSVNHYVKHTRTGRHYVTKEAKAFKAAVPICAQQKQVRYRFYAITIFVYLGYGQKQDIDNCAKVVLDGLVEGGQIHSDAAVTQLCLYKKRDSANPRTCITVWEGKKP
jgi:crossover junction endodeoxyribonuclease RusA